MSIIIQGNGGGSGGVTPSGKKTLTNLQETDVASYATAQVDPTNITATNIKKDVQILGVTGTYEPNLQQKTEIFVPMNNGQVITPDTGYDGLSSVTMQTPANLTAANIKNGVIIGNIMGTYGSDATATTADIAYGKTAYGPVPITGGSGQIEGTLLDSRGSVISVGSAVYADNTYVRLVPEDGFDIIVDGQLGMRAVSSVVAGYAGLTPSILKAGETVLGITGTYAPSATEKYSCLITTSNQTTNNQYACVSGNSFTDYYSQANQHFSASTLYCKAFYGPSGTNHVYFNGTEQTLDSNGECSISLVTDVNITISAIAGSGATITINNI